MNRLIVLVAILALVAGFSSAQPGSLNLDPAKELVAQLYKEHSGKSDPLQYPASKKLLPNYFYKPLLDLYLKDQEDSKAKWVRSTSTPSTILTDCVSLAAARVHGHGLRANKNRLSFVTRLHKNGQIPDYL
jgi:hypothetical protein